MNRRSRRGAVLALLAWLLIAQIGHPVLSVQDRPVTLYRWASVPLTLDPQLAAYSVSAEVVANLFYGLTLYDPESAAIKPAIAAEWRVDSAGTSYTFTLRDDVFWVRYDPETGLTARVRPVTADDFAAGIERFCRQDGSALSEDLAAIVVGCAALRQIDPRMVTEQALAGLGVEAQAPDTLVIELVEPAGWFPALTPLIYPAPRDIIARFGATWTLPGNIVTTGAFVLTDRQPGRRVVVERLNPTLPDAFQGEGNVQRVIFDRVQDTGAGFSLYLADKADISPLPPAEVAGFIGLRPGEAELVLSQRVAYVGFANDRAPFNDPRLRRVFAAAIDREAFVNEIVLDAAGMPRRLLMPESVVGAPLGEDIGMGYDPTQAREWFGEAGYPECSGFPYITVLAHRSTAAWVDWLVESWRDVLGCDRSIFDVELVDFADLLARTDFEASFADQPHIFVLVWRAAHPDSYFWLDQMLWCEAEPRTRRPCSEIDELIAQAMAAPNPSTRRALYTSAEAAFFGPQGDMPVIPLYQPGRWEAVKPWVSRPPQIERVAGSLNALWNRVTIDADWQQRCRNKLNQPGECTAPMATLPPAATPAATPTPTASASPAPATPTDPFEDISIPVDGATPTATGLFEDVVITLTATPAP